MQCVLCVCLCAVRFELEKTQNTFWRKFFVCSVCLPERVEKWATLKGTLFLLTPAPTLIQSEAKIGIVCIKTPKHLTLVSRPAQTIKVLYVSGAVLSTYLKNPAKNKVRLKWMKHLKMSENRGPITKLRGRARLYQQYHISHNGEITYNRDR